LASGRKEEKTECGEGGINKARTVDGAARLQDNGKGLSTRVWHGFIEP
jgi:hypothetical protein